MFLIMGGLVLAAIDQVPYALIDNAIIMGLLSFLVAFIFLIDLSDPLPMRRVSHAQTSMNPTHEIGTQSDQTQGKTEGSYASNLAQSIHPQVGQRIDKDYPRQPTLPADRRPPPFASPPLPTQQRPTKLKHHRVSPEQHPQTPQRQQQFIGNPETTSQRHEPVVGHILTPEKVRAQKTKIPTKGAFIVDEVPKSRRHNDQQLSEDDTMSRISSHSYVRTAEVDTLPKEDNLCVPSIDSCGEKNKECGEEETDSPIVPGYVASTAKMWDKRSKSTSSILGSNTRV